MNVHQPERRSPLAVLLFVLGIASAVGGIVILALSGAITIYLAFMFAGISLLTNATAIQTGHRRQDQILAELAEIRTHLQPQA